LKTNGLLIEVLERELCEFRKIYLYVQIFLFPESTFGFKNISSDHQQAAVSNVNFDRHIGSGCCRFLHVQKGTFFRLILAYTLFV